MQRKVSLLEIKNNLPEVIAVFISLAGLVVMAGWFLNIETIKSISPDWVSMKFSTALSFFLSGLVLYSISRFRRQECDLALVFLPIISMAILLLMMTLLASTVIGANTGVEELFVKDSIVAVASVTPGRPSVATMINFIFIALSGIFTSLASGRFIKILGFLGLAIGLIGLTAVFGYIFNQPLLYFAVTGKSSAVAIHTAVLFVLWGCGAILTAK